MLMALIEPGICVCVACITPLLGTSFDRVWARKYFSICDVGAFEATGVPQSRAQVRRPGQTLSPTVQVCLLPPVRQGLRPVSDARPGSEGDPACLLFTGKGEFPQNWCSRGMTHAAVTGRGNIAHASDTPNDGYLGCEAVAPATMQRTGIKHGSE